MTTHELGSTEHLVALVKTALDNFEQTTLDGSARSALRVARLRGDADDAWMLLHDLRPTGGSDRVRAADVYQLWPEDDPATVRERQRALLEQWIAERRTTLPQPLRAELGDRSVVAGSIVEIGRRVAALSQVAQGITDLKRRTVIDQRLLMEDQALGRIRHRVFSYLCRCERELGFGVSASSIFDRYRQRVDAHLAQLAPEVLEQLSAAYRRSHEGDAEARSHALTSCRRILKSVADIVYPPGAEPVLGRDGKMHDVGPDRYLARIWQFLDRVTGRGETSRKLTTAALQDVGERVERLNDLASKGVHDQVTQEEVDLCVLHCFLLAGELLRLKAKLELGD